MMNNNPNEFQEEFRSQAMEDLLLSKGDTSETPVRQTPLSNSFGPNLSQRATDIPNNINPNSPWGRMVSKFSIDFLLRVHLRKCEFETVRKLVTSGKVTSEENLRLIRDSLLKMEKNVNVDKVLASYLDEMTELRRLTQRKLNSIAKPKTY